MTISFYKYQGTGNDFVIIDNRLLLFPKNDTKLVARLCDRKFGVGADGLMLLENSENQEEDFKMVYYNSDGHLSSMCGNGGRCLVAFASFLGVISDKAVFTAVDGRHTAALKDGLVHLQMQDVATVSVRDSHIFLDTGSPHHVVYVEELDSYAVVEEGARIRYGEPYGQKGSNVNFVETIAPDIFAVRTYERGVENETLSCGTGVTAVALAAHASGRTTHTQVALQTPGGELNVRFRVIDNRYTDIWLIGPAVQVFSGQIDI